MKVMLLIPLAALALTAAGCNSDSSKLEKRVTRLEAQNAKLKDQVHGLEAEQTALIVRLMALDDRTWANDRALWTGVGKAQYDINCGIGDDLDPNSTCVYGDAFPGAVSAALESRRLNVSPWPIARQILAKP